MPHAPKTFRQQAAQQEGAVPPTGAQRIRNSARWQRFRAWLRNFQVTW